MDEVTEVRVMQDNTGTCNVNNGGEDLKKMFSNETCETMLFYLTFILM